MFRVCIVDNINGHTVESFCCFCEKDSYDLANEYLRDNNLSKDNYSLECFEESVEDYL